MKRPITPAYTFTPRQGALDLSGIPNFDIRNLFAVIALKTGALIYAPTAGYGYSALSGTVLTLQAAMTGLSANDPLLILYDDGGKPAEDATLQQVVAALTSSLVNETTALTAITATSTWQANVLAAVQGNGTTLHGDLAAILSKLGGRLSVSIDGDTIALSLPKGQQTAANSLSVVLSSDGPFASNFGFQADAAATDDASAWSLVALVKRGLARWTALLARIPASLGQKPMAGAFPVVIASDQSALPVTGGKMATAGDVAITAGGTAQTLFAGATPANGWKVANPDPAEDLWVSDSATAAPNTLGSYRIPAGGIVTTEPGERPAGPVSIYAATTGHAVTARTW